VKNSAYKLGTTIIVSTVEKTKPKIIVTTMAIPTPNFLARKNFQAAPAIMKLFAKIVIKEVFTSPPSFKCDSSPKPKVERTQKLTSQQAYENYQ